MADSDALAAAFEQHRDHLHAVAYRLLGSASDADDAVQDTWLRMSGADVSAVDNLAAWLTTVVARVSLNMLRSRRREQPAGESWPDAAETAVAGRAAGRGGQGPQDQVSPGRRGQAIVLGEADRAFGARIDAVGAEEAPAQVQPEALVVACNGVRRAGLGAGAAAVGTLRFIEHWQAAEAIGEWGRFGGRIGDRAVALPEALPNDVDHERSLGLEVVPAVGEVEALVAEREIRDLLVS